MLDNLVTFANQQAIADGTAVVSTYIYDAGTPHGGIGTAAAPKLFEGEGQDVIVEVTAAANTGKDDYQIKVDVIAADNADLDSNPVTLATYTTAAIAEASLPSTTKPYQRINIKLRPSGQTAAKRYYGLKFDLTGTGSALTSTVNGYVCRSHQTNLAP